MRLWIQSCARAHTRNIPAPLSTDPRLQAVAPPPPLLPNLPLSLHRLRLRHLLRSHPFVRRLLLSQPPLLNRPCLSLLFTFSLHFMFSPLFSLSLSLSAGSSISTLLNTCTSFAPQQNSIPAKSVSMKLNWNQRAYICQVFDRGITALIGYGEAVKSSTSCSYETASLLAIILPFLHSLIA